MNTREFLGIDSYDRKADGTVMTHEEQQRTIINAIGLDTCITYLPQGGVDRFRKAMKTDKHLNNIPMVEWDACYKIRTISTRAYEERIKAKVESMYKKEMDEAGLIMRARILVMYDEEADKKDFSLELLRLKINMFSPSLFVSLLKYTAIMWVEREDALNANSEEEQRN